MVSVATKLLKQAETVFDVERILVLQFPLLSPEVMWEVEQATVRQVVAILQERRSIAYTTVMTIMNNLVTKGLLKRIPQGKAYLYRVAFLCC